MARGLLHRVVVWNRQTVLTGAEYKVAPGELIQDPGLEAVFRISPHLEVSSQVMDCDGDELSIRERAFFADGGEVARRGTAVRHELEGLVQASHKNGVLLFPTAGQMNLQRGFDRLPTWKPTGWFTGTWGENEEVSVDGAQQMKLDVRRSRAALVSAQAMVLQTDAVQAIFAAAVEAAEAEGVDLIANPARKHELFAAAAKTVAAAIPVRLEAAGFSASDLRRKAALRAARDVVSASKLLAMSDHMLAAVALLPHYVEHGKRVMDEATGIDADNRPVDDRGNRVGHTHADVDEMGRTIHRPDQFTRGDNST